MSLCKPELLYLTRGDRSDGGVLAVSGADNEIRIAVVADGVSGQEVFFDRGKAWYLVCAILKSWWKSRS